MRLFAPNSKTLLLFLIREQCPDENQFGVTPAAQLRHNIESVVMAIWNEIEKPDNFGNTSITDLFDIDFYFMPPLVYYKEQFEAKVDALYERFTNSKDSKYYFHSNYHFSKCVPPEGLYTWTKQIFEAITKDESLNIPDQQKLLSAYRCEHALNEALDHFTAKTADIAEEVKEGMVESFGARLDAVIAECAAMYKETANKYDKEEAAEKYTALVDKIETQIQFLFSFQYKHLEQKVMALFDSEMSAALPSAQSQANAVCVDDLNSVVQRVGSTVRTFFSQQIKQCMISTDNERLLDTERFWKETQKRLREATKSIQLEQWQLLQKENEQLADEHLLAQIGHLLRTPTEDIWRRIGSLRIEYHGQILENRIFSKLGKLMYDEHKLKERRLEISNLSDSLIVNRCKKHCKRMDGVLQDTFARYFSKDPMTGIPRTWDETVKLDEVFTTAKQKSLQILDMSTEMVLAGNEDLHLHQIKLKLLSADTADDIRTDFLRFADNEYRRAEGLIRNANMLGGGILPSHPVTWAIFLFFAKDEIWSMLTNPLYLITFVLGAAILVIGYQAHVYGFDVQTIVMQMASKAVNVVLFKLEEFQRKQKEIQQRGQMRRTRTLVPDDPNDPNGNAPDILE